jgi:small subunit ribosomal protein S20
MGLTDGDLLPYNTVFGTHPSNFQGNTKVTEPMANHFSALKRARQTEKRTARNRANRSQLRSALRELRESLAKGNRPEAEQTYRQTVSALDKAIQKGILHENTAARYKSRLAARVGAVGK